MLKVEHRTVSKNNRKNVEFVHIIVHKKIYLYFLHQQIWTNEKINCIQIHKTLKAKCFCVNLFIYGFYRFCNASFLPYCTFPSIDQHYSYPFYVNLRFW